MKHCEFNFTMKAVHWIYCELKGQTKSVKKTVSKEISWPQYTFFCFLAQHSFTLFWFQKEQSKVFTSVYLNVNFKAPSDVVMSEMIREQAIVLKEIYFSSIHDHVINTLIAFNGTISLRIKVKFLCTFPGSDPSLF